MSFVWTDQLAYRFEGSTGLYSATDVAVVHGQTVRFWENLAAPETFVEQPTSARRPQWFSGGRGGKGFIRCQFTQQQWFNNLPITQPAGNTADAINPYTVFAVVDQVRLADRPALLGSVATSGGKMGVYFRPERDAQIHLAKSRYGNLIWPAVVFCTIGRNAAGQTTSPATRLWYRVNGYNIFAGASDTAGMVSDAIAATQFLRNTGLTDGGYFHGHLYEFLFYNGVLTNEVIFAIEAHLLTKYAIPV